jgi:hypothetical protein
VTDLIGLTQNPQFILNMVCNLMGYDISGCKIAARTHLTLHRRKELCIEKDLVLWRAIKRSSRGRSPPQADCVLPLNKTKTGGS